MSDSLPVLKHRMKIVDDLGAVVRTMKAMAAASITQFEQSAEALEEYSRAVELSLTLYFRRHPPVTEQGYDSDAKTGSRKALLVFGTDQGMVGQFNESLVTQTAARIAKEPVPPLLWVVGERPAFRLETSGFGSKRIFPAPGSIEAVSPLIADVLEEIDRALESGQVDTVEYCHNRPLSRTRYEFTWNRLLPLDKGWEKRFLDLPWPTSLLPELVHESSTTLPSFIGEYLFVSLARACTESAAAENGARLSAMQRAEKNVNDRMREFRLEFNRQRQRGIDEELSDLLAGFEALNHSHGTSHTR